MNKQYFFINGIPRAGNTLLASLLNQNPDIRATANSFTLNLMHQIASKKNDDIFTHFPDHQSIDDVIENIIPSYYKNWNCKYIIERSHVGLEENLELLKKYFKQPIKIIVLVRDIHEVLASFLKVFAELNAPKDKACDSLMSDEGMVGISLKSIENLSKPENSHMTHFVDYKDLINKPSTTLKGIYKFLEIPEYDHRFTNLEQFNVNGIEYNDNYIEMPKGIKPIDLHTIRTDNLSFTKHELLPESIIGKYKEDKWQRLE